MKSFVPVFFLDCCLKVSNNLFRKKKTVIVLSKHFIRVLQIASALVTRDYTIKKRG